MRALGFARVTGPLLAVALAAGCASVPPPGGAAATAPPARPPLETSPPPVPGPLEGAVAGLGGDAPPALYDLRFIQTLPSSGAFNFRDRDLSFYFRPTSAVLVMQVENLQDRPVWIDWDRSVFRDAVGRTSKVAHSTTLWKDRFSVQAQTQIYGLKNYSDYMFPMDYLLDPAGSAVQLHRPLIPVDASAPQYSGREFGVDLVFMIEQQPRNYSFRFKVASVIPHTR